MTLFGTFSVFPSLLACRIRSGRWRMGGLGMLGVLSLAGCVGVPAPREPEARAALADVTARYRPGDARPDLPELGEDSDIAVFLEFAMLNHPEVEAAYYDWVASVETITLARSLPDPRLTFQADITTIVGAAMAGLMMDLPGPGKLRAVGEAATAGSEGRYFAFESEILRVAFAVKSAYYRLHFLEDSIRVSRETLTLLNDLEQLARQQHATGRATLQDVLRAQIEQERLANQIENQEDSRNALLADFKAALGLGPDAADPPVPDRFVASPPSADPAEIQQTALRRNPTLGRLAADVQRAQATLDLARRAGVPDFSIGVMADVRPSPWMWSPSAAMTLPIWRDKIAASMAAAQADKQAAEARLDSEQIRLVADLAMMLYQYRESLRNADILENRLISRGRQSLQATRAGYATGRSSFLDVIDAYRQLLEFDLALIDARTQRELALASLSLMIAGAPPEGSPTLSFEKTPYLAGEKELTP